LLQFENSFQERAALTDVMRCEQTKVLMLHFGEQIRAQNYARADARKKFRWQRAVSNLLRTTRKRGPIKRKKRTMAGWTREWTLNTPTSFKVVAAAFIAMSIYFAFAPVSTRFGTIAAYAYSIVGFGLIGVLCVSLRLEFEDQRSGSK
jgi:hypothetical protein